MEKMLHNIFLATNATDLNGPSLESCYKILPSKVKNEIFSGLCNFYGLLNYSTILTLTLL